MEKRGECVHGPVHDEQNAPRSVSLWREIALELGELIQFILNKPRQMGAKDSSFVSRGSWLEIADNGILAQASAEGDNLREANCQFKVTIDI